MKLFELKPVEILKDNVNPWEPWYDKYFGFIIRAETEEQARDIADKNAGDENDKRKHPWLISEYSTCTELINEGKPGIIMSDFRRT